MSGAAGKPVTERLSLQLDSQAEPSDIDAALARFLLALVQDNEQSYPAPSDCLSKGDIDDSGAQLGESE